MEPEAATTAFTLLLSKLISRTHFCCTYVCAGHFKFGTHKSVSLSYLSHLAFCFTLARQESCGPIGNSDETETTPLRNQRFYLNTADPAPCTGNITSWRVCYYGPDDVDNLSGSYWATYAVYRRTGSGDDVHYERVSEMFRALRTIERFTDIDGTGVDGEILEGGFNCYNDSIDTGNSPLTVQAGDILGACVFDPENIVRGTRVTLNRLQLDIVGDVSGQSLLQTTDTSECSTVAIPSNIPANQLSAQSSRRLHLYANIGNSNLRSAL